MRKKLTNYSYILIIHMVISFHIQSINFIYVSLNFKCSCDPENRKIGILPVGQNLETSQLRKEDSFKANM